MGDAVFAGGTGDSTALLTELLRQPLEAPALVPLCDPVAARAAAAAGPGAEINLTVGGRHQGAFSSPLPLTGRVVGVSDAPVEVDGGFFGLQTVDQGLTALLRVGQVELVISERPGLAGSDPVVYRQFGVEPADAGIAVLKTAANVHRYAPMTRKVLRAATPGHTQSELESFTWRRLPRPIHGLDVMEALTMGSHHESHSW